MGHSVFVNHLALVVDGCLIGETQGRKQSTRQFGDVAVHEGGGPALLYFGFHFLCQDWSSISAGRFVISLCDGAHDVAQSVSFR